MMNMIVAIFIFSSSLNLYASEIRTAESIATFFLSARAVISSNSKLIADPTTAGITPADFINSTKDKYRATTGKNFDDTNNEGRKFIIIAIESVMKDAIEGKYKNSWSTGAYSNKFLPARFAREVAVSFSQLMKGKMFLRLTTQNDFLVNIENKADEWENKTIENSFLKGKFVPVYENTVFQNKKTFRFITPERFSSSCLGCHGYDAGKKLHPSGRTGEEGAFGGAVSFGIYK